MKYTLHSEPQGTPEWLAGRNTRLNASELVLAAGSSMNGRTRTDLIRKLATGIEPEITEFQQKLFDDGHRFEALARPLMEQIIGRALYPITASVAVDGLTRRIGSSLDGATDDDEINAEHKSMNEELRAALLQGIIPEDYHWQMEQGQMVNGATRTLFMASKWDDNDQLIEELHAWYESRPELRARIIPIWKQAEEDAANYQHQDVIPAAVAAPQEQLPALTVVVSGSVAVRDNLAVFGNALRAYIDGINRKPETDNDFATIKAASVRLREVQTRLSSAKESMLGQLVDVDTVRRAAEDLEELARVTAIELEKIHESETKNRKTAIVEAGKKAAAEHIASLNTRIGKPYMPAIAYDFAGKTKGLKNLASYQNAVDTELARVKIEANAVADRIDANLKTLRELAADHAFLFADTSMIVQKAPEDLTALVKSRIAEHKEAEAKRLEDERAKIRAEEEAKAAAKVKAEQEEEQRNLVTTGTAFIKTVVSESGEVSTTAIPTNDVYRDATIKLGEINAALGFTVTSEFLALLGFNATTERNAKLYRACDFQRICAAIARHCDSVGVTQMRRAA